MQDVASLLTKFKKQPAGCTLSEITKMKSFISGVAGKLTIYNKGTGEDSISIAGLKTLTNSLKEYQDFIRLDKRHDANY